MLQGATEHGDRGGACHLIGPNSVLQLLPVLDARLGKETRRRLLHEAGLGGPPSDRGLMPEKPAARLHQALRRHYPERAAAMTREAGARTGDYIIQHRIPGAVVRALSVLPPPLAGRLLAGAIARHAWTFAGSGHFRMVAKWPAVFELHDNPVVRGEASTQPLCDWHAAVFERLYRRLVDERLRCVETRCCACGDDSCRFVIE
jgi:divinyl protochlorophyllide a 8-vinyl-reductase